MFGLNHMLLSYYHDPTIFGFVSFFTMLSYSVMREYILIQGGARMRSI